MKTDWQNFRDSFEKFVVQDLKKSLSAGVEARLYPNETREKA